MNNYLTDVNSKFPIRNTKTQKEEFRKYVMEESKKIGWSASIETLQEKHHNIIIGDLKKSKVIITAHYDTPRGGLLPNIMMPTNRVLFWAYQFLVPIIMVAVSYFIAKVFEVNFMLERYWMLLIFLLVYYVLFFLLFRLVKNPHNINDNTSGVAGVLELMKTACGQDKVSFVLFDNEELGKKGSKALYKSNPKLFQDKLLINMDCIGNGENIIVVTPKNKCIEYEQLKDSFVADKKYNVNFYTRKEAQLNSDQQSFPNGIAVCACKKNKLIGYYTPRIHTFLDTVASNDNIIYIRDSLQVFINKLEC